ncbi:MAG: uracil-DNA glycosylase [candidate division Zixibacteria bacterium]|nr:uracil-DNA glycosylase [candidate division Zixibacteria bacterium]
MKDSPFNIYEMLRRAAQSQVDMGIGEVIISRRTSSEDQVVDSMRETRRVVSALDLFGQAGGPPQKTPQFDSLEDHYQSICDCQLCPLGQNRNKFVYGVGNPKADLIFIGEGPGAREDELGEPFVGRAGELLDRILAAIQLSRRDVYIGNIVKCRPPGNRDPLPEEMDMCLPHLVEQIRIIDPKVICCLGRVAAQALLKTKTPLGRLRNQWHDYEGIPTMVTYHPAALLRFPAYKRETWEDMQKLKARYDQERSG